MAIGKMKTRETETREIKMGKVLRVNLAEKKVQWQEMGNAYRDLGGRGLVSRIIANEVPPEIDPLSEANKLIVASGILGGTAMPNSGRLSIGAKSPLTGTIKEANAGGSAAQKLARLGIQALVLEGRAREWVSIVIDKNGVGFENAKDLSGTGNQACIASCREKHGDSISIVSIGQAGEMQLQSAGVAVTTPDFFPRMAARGGMGAVMGSKNVKSLIIDDTGGQNPPIKDMELFKASVKAFTRGVLSHPLIEGLSAFGTPVLVGLINEMGAISTRNFSLGRFEGAQKISGEHIAELIKQRSNAKSGHNCMSGCVVKCSNIFTDEKGERVVSGLEYETIALMGANCMIGDIDIIAQMNAVCNDAGVDTMDVGGAIAVAMEAGMLPWGDGPGALALTKEIAKGTETGRMIGNGCRFTGEKLGVERIPHVKGQCLAGYDPRILKGTGVTYATAPMGADHTCGNALPSPANPDYNPSASGGQGAVSGFLQRYFAAVDTLGMCLFAMLPPLDMPELQKHVIDAAGAVMDEPLDENYLMRLGGEVLKDERKFNAAAGFGVKDDRLPEFFTAEPVSPVGEIFDVPGEELDGVHN